MSRRSAYQLISAATVVENVRNCAQILPLNEAQARPLTALPPEQQREAWEERAFYGSKWQSYSCSRCPSCERISARESACYTQEEELSGSTNAIN